MRHFLDADSVPSSKDITAALKDFMPYHAIDQVMRMYAEYCNHGNYGYAGGVLDQPEKYWLDMAMMRWLELWVKHVAPLTVFHRYHNHEDVIHKLKRGGTL